MYSVIRFFMLFKLFQINKLLAMSLDSQDNNSGKGFLSKVVTSFFSSGKSDQSAKVEAGIYPEKVSQQIEQSSLLSRDLSWMKFNERVLDQACNPERNLFDRLKFLAITASNLDEFFSIRVGSLYNYLDYNKERVDYSGLREIPFRKTLFREAQMFNKEQDDCFTVQLAPQFEQAGFQIIQCNELLEHEEVQVADYFEKTVYPMLTPMLYDYTHVFPVLNAKVLILGVVTHIEESPIGLDDKKLSFVQLPSNLPRFYQIYRDNKILLLPIEQIVKRYVRKLYRNVDILSISLFRIIRNGDFSLDEIDDTEEDFIDEIKQKIKGRRLGRVVKMDIAPGFDEELLKLLQKRLEIDKYNIFQVNGLLDYTSLWQIVKTPEFKEFLPPVHASVIPLDYGRDRAVNIFDAIKEKDIFLHHPYNSFEPVLHLLEKAAEDPQVLSIKLTIYRVAKKSRVTEALLRAAENGKHVSVLFEVKARFDEENNISEAEKLQKAGCFVIHGIGMLKTHTKLLLIVRKEGEKVVRYAHMSSGNYNEDTARLYTDVGLLTANEEYTYDISEFFNVITGHSHPAQYRNLITAPRQMRNELIRLINIEAENAQKGLPSGICIKINSLEDKEVIYELYRASQAGVKIKLIIRGICCLRPGRAGLSENITVRSIVGDNLEHSRLFYFHNAGDPKVYGGSADVMVRSFDRRIESLFRFVDPIVKQEAINILVYNLRDNQNAYELQEDGSYIKTKSDEPPFNIHEEFYNVTIEDVLKARLFVEEDAAIDNLSEVSEEEESQQDNPDSNLN